MFRQYIYDYDDFELEYNDYLFTVAMDESDVKVSVDLKENYKISLVYFDDCLCFTDIKYN